MQNLVKFHPFILKILSGNQILTKVRGHNSDNNRWFLFLNQTWPVFYDYQITQARSSLKCLCGHTSCMCAVEALVRLSLMHTRYVTEQYWPLNVAKPGYILFRTVFLRNWVSKASHHVRNSKIVATTYIYTNNSTQNDWIIIVRH